MEKALEKAWGQGFLAVVTVVLVAAIAIAIVLMTDAGIIWYAWNYVGVPSLSSRSITFAQALALSSLHAIATIRIKQATKSDSQELGLSDVLKAFIGYALAVASVIGVYALLRGAVL